MLTCRIFSHFPRQGTRSAFFSLFRFSGSLESGCQRSGPPVSTLIERSKRVTLGSVPLGISPALSGYEAEVGFAVCCTVIVKCLDRAVVGWSAEAPGSPLCSVPPTQVAKATLSFRTTEIRVSPVRLGAAACFPKSSPYVRGTLPAKVFTYLETSVRASTRPCSRIGPPSRNSSPTSLLNVDSAVFITPPSRLDLPV